MFNEPVKLLRGAFIDHKGRKWDCNEAELECYFERKSGMISSASTISTFSSFFTSKNIHYFCLKGNRIFFALNSTSDPIGMINLETSLNIRRLNDNTLKLSNEDDANIVDILLYHESKDVISSWYDLIILKIMTRESLVTRR